MRHNAEDVRSNAEVEIIPEEENVLLAPGIPRRLAFFTRGVGEQYAEHVGLEDSETAEVVLRVEKDEEGTLSVGLFESTNDGGEEDVTSALDEVDEAGAKIIERESLKFARIIARQLDGVELDAEALAEVIAEATAVEVLDAAEVEDDD
jgi:hypothetical protein